MTWNAADIPDLTNKVAVVTGANGGLGLETARELARKGAAVVMAARNIDKAEGARNDVLRDVPSAAVDLRRLDLASLESVESFATAVLADYPTIDILVNNAGVMGIPRLETNDRFEMQFGTNHLGHFVLTARLLPALLRSGAGRVVTVTSTGRHFGRPVDPADPHLTRDYDPWRSYGQSKLANLHFAVELDHRLAAAGADVESLVVHPGYVHTDLQKTSSELSPGGRSQRFYATTVRWVGMSPARGALPQLRAATDPAARGGEFYTPRWVSFGPPVRRPILARSRRQSDLDTLWDVSERETGVSFDVAAMVTRAAA